MCSSVETTGHNFVDDQGPRDTGPQYRAANGETRQWQRCTGCGNVQTRRVVTFSSVKPAFFRKHFEAARQDSDQIAAATSPFDPTASRGTRYFEWSDGFHHAGFAVRADGELVYVFSTLPGLGGAIVKAAISEGAVYLDCFDGYLPSLYARFGFQADAHVPNWRPDGPDVVYMSLPGYSSRHGV
jgi:hypothetical protein